MNSNIQLPSVEQLSKLIRTIPDYPKPGIGFKDITPLLRDPAGLALAVEFLAQPFRGKGVELVCGAESRGFIFGTAVAQALSAGFIPIRKPGKLPSKVHRFAYELEYGSDVLEIHQDAFEPGQTVLMVDDLLATGGTMSACCELVNMAGGQIVAVAVLIELAFLAGREKFKDYEVISVIRFDDE